MICLECNGHYCLTHRNHGCGEELVGKEARRLLREAAKKSKEHFAIVKENADKKVG